MAEKAKDEDEAITIPVSNINICRDDVLGRGGYGMVYRGHLTSTGDMVAVKLLISEGSLPKRNIRDLKREAQRLKQLTNHRHILNMYGVLMEPNHYGLVLEYMHFGSSANFVKDFDVDMPLLLRITRQVIAAMLHLHSHTPPILHLDMKADNILINNFLEAKICDFGLSEWKTVTCTVTRGIGTGRRCTISHIAPEVLADINAPSTKALDIYAFGITLWELLTGQNVYNDRPENLVRESVLNNQRPDLRIMPPHTIQIQVIISKCWQQDPNGRPQFSALQMEVEPIFKAYEKHLPAALKSIRRQICEKFAVNDPEYIDTEHLDAIEVEITEETAEDNDMAISAVPVSLMETDQPITDQGEVQETPATLPPPVLIPVPVDGHRSSDPLVLNMDVKNRPIRENEIKKMTMDAMGSDVRNNSSLTSTLIDKEVVDKISNPRALQELVNNDTLLRFTLMRSNSPFFTASRCQRDRHAKFQCQLLQKQEREQDSQKFYSYQKHQRPDEMDADEKRRYDKMMDLRVCTYGKKLAQGGIGDKVIKALKEPYYLKQALIEPDPKPGEPKRFKVIDPKVKELVQDPMILQIVLSQEPEILDSLMRQYPNLLMKMLAEGKTEYKPASERRQQWHRSDREMSYMLRMMRHPDHFWYGKDDDSDDDERRRMHRDPMRMMGMMGMMGGSRERRRQEEMMNQIQADRRRKEKEEREKKSRAEKDRIEREKQQKKEQEKREKQKKKEKPKDLVTEKMEIEQLKQKSASELKLKELQRLREIERRRKEEQSKKEKDGKGGLPNLFEMLKKPQRDLKRENSASSPDASNISMDQLSMEDANTSPQPSPPKQTRDDTQDPPVVKAEIQQANALPARPGPTVKQEPAEVPSTSQEARGDNSAQAPQEARGDNSARTIKGEKMEVDAHPTSQVPGRTASPKGATGGVPSPLEISHKHAGGGETNIILHGNMDTVPNLQIGNKNTMVVLGGSRDDDEPGGKKKSGKTKKMDLSKFPEALLSMEQIDKIAMGIGKDWKRLCRELDLTEAEIEQLQHDYQINGLYEMMYQGIQRWIQKKGRASTVRLMAKNLWTIGRDDIALDLK